MSQPLHNRVFNHVAVSVPNCQTAIDWYSQIFGFQLIGNQIHHIKRSERPNDPIFSIYRASLDEVKMAYMSTGNGVGFELFEFVHPKTYVPETVFEYHRAGLFHVCVTDSQPDSLAARMVEAGGRRIGQTVHPVENVVCLYAADPWGNVVEILDASFDRMATLASKGVR
ncbi:Glyoxalase/Bleomycin resistance protein/Dihydroxybiphenyl dioxygenase [Aspergillus sergii]|uniref:Glyoxalase/Bleomycin resistance protein/Dihydroxybiphenyl dioxygenase n=1 Tax=Aspergillus sergii TaxID=1034303 RepID=A0A5N6XAD7_9EURO|nr:Glyoxalase/Bleomycin resistance protein/Dihydroxybiphenyl dioxygenase [Aspergillus sergii]